MILIWHANTKGVFHHPVRIALSADLPLVLEALASLRVLRSPLGAADQPGGPVEVQRPNSPLSQKEL